MKNNSKKFYQILTDDSTDTAEVRLYGEIVSNRPTDWMSGETDSNEMIVLSEFLDDLKAVKNKSEITVHLNSVGGEVFAGVSIHNALKALHGKKKVVIDGVAASAATLIACAADELEVYTGSVFMMHAPSQFLYGGYNAHDLKQEIDGLKACTDSAAEIYAEKTGKTVDEYRAFMNAGKEVWLVGKEILDAGFASKLLTSGSAACMSLVDGPRKFLNCAGVNFELKSFESLPQDLQKLKVVAETTKIEQTEPAKDDGQEQKERVDKMDKKIETVEQLREEFPQLVAEIEKGATASVSEEAVKAVTAERERIKAIEEIAPMIGNAEMIAAAKFGADACDAKELAYRATLAGNKLRSKALEDMKSDAEKSGAKGVKAVPAPTKEMTAAQSEIEARKASIDKAVAAVNARAKK